MWFKATEGGSFDIVCAELCGWGHYKMKGRIHLLTRDGVRREARGNAARTEHDARRGAEQLTVDCRCDDRRIR